MRDNAPVKTCDECDESFVNNSKWDSIRAHSKGWYFLKNGKAFCPKHRPHYAPPFKSKGKSK